MTETCSTGTISEKDDLSVGEVGVPLPDVDLKLVSWNEGCYSVSDEGGARGEIHLGGGNIASGYYNMPDKTNEEFYEENGKRWFKTGDIGQIMPNGAVKIIDRKKDLVKLQMGEYVSLGKIESILKLHKIVENICVCAEPTESFTVCLIVPDEQQLTSFVAAKKTSGNGSFTLQEILQNGSVLREILQELTRHGLSMGLEKFEMPKKLTLITDLWTPDSGMVTAAMKLKRKEIGAKYAPEIRQMYSEATQNTVIDFKTLPTGLNNNKIAPA